MYERLVAWMSVIRNPTVCLVFSVLVLVEVLTNTCWVQEILCLGCPVKMHGVKGVKKPSMVACQTFVCVYGETAVVVCQRGLASCVLQQVCDMRRPGTQL